MNSVNGAKNSIDIYKSALESAFDEIYKQKCPLFSLPVPLSAVHNQTDT